MDFLGIGPLELMFVILIALIVIGPKDMSKTARAAGRAINRMYRSEAWRTLTQASRTLQTLPNRLAREAQLEELEELRKDLDNKPQPAVAQNPTLEPWITPYNTPEKFQTIAPPAPPAHAQVAKPETAQPARTKPPATTAGKPSASKTSGAGKSTKGKQKPSVGPKKRSTRSSKSRGAKRKASSATPSRSSTSGRSSSSQSKPTGRSGR